MARAKAWNAHNRAVINLKFEEFLQHRACRLVIAKMRKVADAMLANIDSSFQPLGKGGGNENFPVYTGNLRDSTGVAIYNDGKIEMFIPPQFASDKQVMFPYYQAIWGTPFLKEAIEHGASTFNKGYWLVLFSAVPYASLINRYGSPAKRGKGYFKEFATTMSKLAKSEFNTSIVSITGRQGAFVKDA